MRIRNLLYLEPVCAQGFLSTFSDSSNADIFITDVQGKTLLCSEGGNCIHTQQSIPDKIMKDVLNNGFVSTSNLGGIYPIPIYRRRAGDPQNPAFR